MTIQATELDGPPQRWRRWTDPRGLRAAGFFTTLMDRCQLYFIFGSAIVMGIVYVVTLGIAMAAAQLVTI